MRTGAAVLDQTKALQELMAEYHRDRVLGDEALHAGVMQEPLISSNHKGHSWTTTLPKLCCNAAMGKHTNGMLVAAPSCDDFEIKQGARSQPLHGLAAFCV